MGMSSTAAASTSTPAHKVRIASSSLLALKAEISRKTSTATTPSSTSTPPTTYTRGTSNPSTARRSQPSQSHHRSNPGLAQRQAKDRILYEQDLDQQGGRIDHPRRSLENKARMYDLIKKGEASGLEANKLSQVLVDFDAKDQQAPEPGEEESSSEEPESDQGGTREDPRDPMVEYLDEFGRTHRVPRSLVPPGIALPSNLVDPSSSSTNVYYGDQRHFPIYQPDPEKLAQIAKETKRSKGALVDRYDASKEKRTRGAGHLDLGQDEKTRKQRLDSLNRIREEAKGVRAALVEAGGVKGKREMDKEERKRRLRDKRQEVEKRREKRVGTGEGGEREV